MHIRIYYKSISAVLFTGAVLLGFFQPSLMGQSGKDKKEEPWKTILYAKEVDYGSFACSPKYTKNVSDFFKTSPLKSFLPICHNDCPIVSCRPVIRFPPTAKAVGATGTVKVHVLVDQEGKVIYARVLSGHPLLRTAAVEGSCQTEFKPYPYNKHQGIMEFTVDGYEFLGVPSTANRVWD